jgi:undecaprenyl-diphosphatase
LLFGGVLLPLYLFGVLAEEVLEREILSFDRPIQLMVHTQANAALDGVMIFFSRLGSVLVLVPADILVFFILMRRGARMQSAFWLLVVAGAALLNLLAKNAFARVRPDLWVSPLPETTFSFPSGHAMQSMAVVAGLVVLTRHGRRGWLVALIGAVFVMLVGLSRIYLGVHYPSDIFAGWAASLAWAAGLSMLFKNSLRNPQGGGSPSADSSPVG